MTLQEAMNYRGENPATLSDKLAVQEGYVRRWCKPGGLLKLSAVRLQQLAQALDGGILIAEDGAEVELYGNGGRV
jgi:DNA-binding transcriptional regulator YdaS (Cro superfamily)